MGLRENHDIIRVDHNNHNTLDNRKNNLKVVEPAKNSGNRKGANKNGVSGERNVNIDRTKKEWVVQMMKNGEKMEFGRFSYDDLDKAIALARRKRKEIFGKV